ncbi:hypothetical protein BH24ACT15_BH24ACT15_16190 [soil metagenome]
MSDQRQKLDSLLAEGVLTSEEHAAAVGRLPADSTATSATADDARATDDWSVVPLPGVDTDQDDRSDEDASTPPPGLPDVPRRPPTAPASTDSGAFRVEVDPDASDAGPDLPAGLEGVGGKVRQWAASIFVGPMKPYWIAAGTGIGIAALLATLGMLYVLITEDGENVPVIRLLLATFTGSAPLSVHAAATGTLEGVGEFGETFTAVFRVNLPLTMLSVLMLGLYGWRLNRLWRRVPPTAGLKGAAMWLVKAIIPFVVIMGVLALLTRLRYTQEVDIVTVRQTVSVLSTLWWATLLGGGTAAAVMTVRLLSRSRVVESRPWLQEVGAAVRGAMTSAVLLIVLGTVIALLFFISQRPDGLTATTLLSYVLLALLYLPTVVVYSASLSAGIPITADLSDVVTLGVGEGLAANPSIGLFGIEGIPTEGGPAVYVWLAFLVALLALIAGGLAATWTAARLGVRTSFAGAGQGLVLALAWIPLTRLFAVVFSATLNDSEGALSSVAEFFGFSGALDALQQGISVRAGLDTSTAFFVMLLLGGVCGYVGSLFAAPLWHKLPNWLSRRLGGGPLAYPGGTATAPSAHTDGGSGGAQPAVPPIPPPGPLEQGPGGRDDAPGSPDPGRQ